MKKIIIIGASKGLGQAAAIWFSKLDYKIALLSRSYLNLEKVRKKGYSLNEAETFDYVYGIGAPIMDSQKRAIAAIAISGTKGSINVKTVEDLANKVTDTAKLISKKLIEN